MKESGFLSEIKVEEVMRSPVLTIFVDDSLSKAAEIFVRERIYYLPVVQSNKKLVGLLTQKYLYKMRSPRRIIGEEFEEKMDTIVDGHSYYYKDMLDSYILKNIMYQTPAKALKTDSLNAVIKNMAKSNVGCVTVVDEKDVVCGILTEKDIINYLAKKVL
ncbi:MAG: CBS domain-containing protein [Candidatus Omnitrophica bacterium]|nr:CBS domain-containing protein [Candidatus Omnitrophota bacterium]